MNLGIVTSFFNGYGRFLPAWANSVAAMDPKPAAVTAVAGGPEPGLSREEERKAFLTLQAAGLFPILIWDPRTLFQGGYRNKAVEMTATEWILYLDVDDAIMPGAINAYRKKEAQADVISAGLRIEGERGGSRDLFFPYASAAAVLQGRHCACSHSVYRREFWMRSPYLEIDFCEQTFWIGLAHQRARFVPLPEICTTYRRRTGSHSYNMTNKDRAAARAMHIELRAKWGGHA